MDNLATASDNLSWDSMNSLHEACVLATEIASSIAALREDTKDQTLTFNTTVFYPKDSTAFPIESVRELQKSLKEAGINVGRLVAELRQLNDGVSSLMNEHKHNPEQKLPPEVAQKVSDLSRQLDQTPKLRNVKAAIDQKRKTAEMQRDRAEEQSQVDEAMRVGLLARQTKAEDALKQVQLKRDRILFMAWLPDLTLRAGVVVLLLFLTQILLSTYRYTLSLSSFYLARSDVIQMLLPDHRGQYSIEHVRMLAEAFSPDALRVDAVVDPGSQLAKLAEAWIGRKA